MALMMRKGDGDYYVNFALVAEAAHTKNEGFIPTVTRQHGRMATVKHPKFR